MSDFRRCGGVAGRLLIVIVAVILTIGSGPVAMAAEPQLRGIWMHANFIRTPAEADRCVDILQRANFNAVFLLVWYWGGQAAFDTPLCPMLEGVQAGYDPLRYMVQECRRRQIEVHAWFVNGAYGHPQPLHVLDQHPDWVVDSGGEKSTLWYDLGKPEVRKFQSDLMIEALTRYDLDGIHFDFIRYDGPAMCYCKHCQTEFSRRYGCGPIEPLRAASFPFVWTIVGNPVAKPTTAKVLAQFSDGTPAIATHELGTGKVLLFNWHAVRSPLPPVVETLSRALRQWNAPRDRVFVMDTAPNRERYGGKGTNEAAEAFRKLGCGAAIVSEDRLDQLSPGSLLVLADVYLIPDEVAQSLEQFVRAGGLLVVIDGPVRSIGNASIQRVLGMRGTAKYINHLPGWKSSSPSAPATCCVVRGHQDRPGADQPAAAQQVAEYRKSGVTELVRDVYQPPKQAKPDAQVTAAVFSSLAWPRTSFKIGPAGSAGACRLRRAYGLGQPRSSSQTVTGMENSRSGICWNRFCRDCASIQESRATA